MATWERRERTVQLTEYAVPTHEPWGACWSEVSRALDAAIDELRRGGGHESFWEPADDVIRIHPGDNEIVIRIETES